MQMHLKKRIEIVIETPLMRRIVQKLDDEKVTGYSVFPMISGRGHQGEWTTDGQVGTSEQMVTVVSIVDANRVDSVVQTIFELLTRQIGFVTVSDVLVMRPDRF